MAGGRAAVAKAVVVALWIVFVLATNLRYGWDRTSQPDFPIDVFGYERAAEAAPSLPDRKTDPQHAQRFVPHYLVGLASDATGLTVRRTYDVFAAFVLAAIALLAHRVFSRLVTGIAAYGFLMGALVTNPWSFRFIIGAPGLLADAVFVLGTAIAMVGLIERRTLVLSLGLAVGVLGRGDTSVLVLLAVGVWLALDRRWWTGSSLQQRLVRSLAVVLPGAVCWLVTNLVARSFSTGETPGLFTLTLLGTLRGLPGEAANLADHVVRVGLGVAVPLVVLAVGLWLAWSGRRPVANPPWLIGSLVLAAAVVVQPLLLNPDWLDGSEPRLSALALVPLLAAGAHFLARVSIRPIEAGAMYAGVALASLHPRYAEISPASTSGRFLPFLLLALVLISAGYVRAASLSPNTS